MRGQVGGGALRRQVGGGALRRQVGGAAMRRQVGGAAMWRQVGGAAVLRWYPEICAAWACGAGESVWFTISRPPYGDLAMYSFSVALAAIIVTEWYSARIRADLLHKASKFVRPFESCTDTIAIARAA